MRRITIALLCVLTLSAGPAQAQAQAQMDRAALVQVAPSVVRIESVDGSGRLQLGSGVIVAEDKVATNCHVTRRAGRVYVVQSGVRLHASAQASDMLRDLCVLEVRGLERARVAPLGASANLKSGQALTAIGFTGGIQQISDGEVVALHPYAGSRIVRSSNWFNSGASGGGLFNQDGQLVGILTFRLRGGAAHYFAAPADWLLDGLDEQDRYVEIAPLAGQAFWELQADAQPYFLQAAALEQGRQWAALARLAQRWAAESAREPEAPYFLGVAYDGLDQLDDSVQALRHCLTLDPAYSRGWVKLATIYKRQGRTGDVRLVLQNLATLDPEQARALTQELEHP